MAENGNGEGSATTVQPEYGGTMIHDSNIPEGGTETGSVANEGQIIDLNPNPVYDELDPVFRFVGLDVGQDNMKILFYILVGYLGIWKGLLKK
jgi:hypothetical protein